jgi:hypothetical protein
MSYISSKLKWGGYADAFDLPAHGSNFHFVQNSYVPVPTLHYSSPPSRLPNKFTQAHTCPQLMTVASSYEVNCGSALPNEQQPRDCCGLYPNCPRTALYPVQPYQQGPLGSDPHGPTYQ